MLLAAEVLGVALGVFLPLLRQIVERENRGNWAHRHARAAINALDWIDVQHLFSSELIAVLLGVDAVHRTGIDAGRVFGADTGFRDYISHKTVSPHSLSVLEDCSGWKDLYYQRLLPVGPGALYG